MKETWDERIKAWYARVSIVYLLFYMRNGGDDCACGLQ